MNGASLWLVRLAVDPVALRLFAEREGVADDDLGYAMHLALRRRFGSVAPQPFRWPAPMREGERVLLGYAADGEALAAARADIPEPALPDWGADWDRPDPLAAIFPGWAETKPMPAAWQAGQRLGFDLRVRPVVRYGSQARLARAAENANGGGERDVFLASIDRRDRAGGNIDTEPVVREAAYLDWLRERLASAASVEAVRLTMHRRCRVTRRRHDAGRYARFDGPEAVVEGRLTVVDPARFSQLLTSGVGRHAAFGFGMLLLRPAGR